VLVNGALLADLMIDYGVGVSTTGELALVDASVLAERALEPLLGFYAFILTVGHGFAALANDRGDCLLLTRVLSEGDRADLAQAA
jgi:hypothetical protein